MTFSNFLSFRRTGVSEDLLLWKSKFIEAGCNEEVIDFVLKQKIIQNYDYLYQQFTRLPPSMRNDIESPWELFCLSGEPAAFDFVTDKNTTAKKIVKEGQIKPSTIGKFGISALDYAILSGKPEQINKALEFGIEFNKHANNALNLAALSGSESVIHMVVEQDPAQLFCVDKKCRTPLHYAAASGSLEAIKKLQSYQKINILAVDCYEHNALVYSTSKGHHEVNAHLKSHNLTLNEDHLKDHSFGEIDSRYKQHRM